MNSFEPESWPPKRKAPRTLTSLLMLIERLYIKGKFVWIRNRFGDHALTVAFTKDDMLMAYRFWPRFRPIQLLEDGTAKSLEEETAQYVDQWIAYREADKVYMFIQNSEIYLARYEEE